MLDELHDVEQQLADITEALGDGTLTVAVAGPAAKSLEDRRRTLTDRIALAVPQQRPHRFASGRSSRVMTFGKRSAPCGWMPRTTAPGIAFRRRWAERQLSESDVAQLHDFLAQSIEHAAVSPRERRAERLTRPE